MFEYLASSDFDFPLCKAFLFIKARDYKKNEKVYVKRLYQMINKCYFCEYTLFLVLYLIKKITQKVLNFLR